MVDDQDMIALDGAIEQLREVDHLFADLDVGICALHLEACIAALESRMLKARSGEVPMRRINREARSPAR